MVDRLEAVRPRRLAWAGGDSKADLRATRHAMSVACKKTTVQETRRGHTYSRRWWWRRALRRCWARLRRRFFSIMMKRKRACANAAA